MVARGVQMFKVTLVGLHFAPIDEVESHADEDLLDFFDRAREDVPAAQMAGPPGQGDVQALLLPLPGAVAPTGATAAISRSASSRTLAISSCIPSSRQNEARSRPWDESAFFRGTTRLPGRRRYPLGRALYPPRHGGASGGTTHGGAPPVARARFTPRLGSELPVGAPRGTSQSASRSLKKVPAALSPASPPRPAARGPV